MGHIITRRVALTTSVLGRDYCAIVSAEVYYLEDDTKLIVKDKNQKLMCLNDTFKFGKEDKSRYAAYFYYWK